MKVTLILVISFGALILTVYGSPVKKIDDETVGSSKNGPSLAVANALGGRQSAGTAPASPVTTTDEDDDDDDDEDIEDVIDGDGKMRSCCFSLHPKN